ncbi:MAG: hypothetical protein QM651_19340 [Rhodoblastus sp.]
MIPLSTPPGTSIVAKLNVVIGSGPERIVRGQVYTLMRWDEAIADGRPLVLCAEVDHVLHPVPAKGWRGWLGKCSFHQIGFNPEWFELLALPSCLTDLLKQEPTPKRQLVGEATSESGGCAPLPPKGRIK